MDQATLHKIAEWREKAIAGTLSVEEMREAIVLLRADRKSAITKSSTKAAKAAIPDADSLLDELGL